MTAKLCNCFCQVRKLQYQSLFLFQRTQPLGLSLWLGLNVYVGNKNNDEPVGVEAPPLDTTITQRNLLSG